MLTTTSNERCALTHGMHYVVRHEINQREDNEDSFQVLPLLCGLGQSPLVMLAIADGMGGHAHGEHVSREALRRISLGLMDALCVSPAINQGAAPFDLDPEALAKALYGAFHQANDYIRRMVESNQWGKAGTTIVVALIVGDRVVVGNLGDSPLLHYAAESEELMKRTQDHTVAGVLLQAGMITPEMARVHEGKTQLEFFLGAERLPKEPPIQQLTLQEGDLLLLCSDGVSGALTEEQIGELVRDETASLDEIADRLIQAALDAGETDNQTVILWRHTTGIESEGCAALDVAEAEGEQEDGGSDDLLDVAAPERPETDPPSSVSDEAPPANAGKKTWRLWGRRNQR